MRLPLLFGANDLRVDEEAVKSPDCSWKVLVMRRKATAAKSSKLTMSMKFQKLLK